MRLCKKRNHYYRRIAISLSMLMLLTTGCSNGSIAASSMPKSGERFTIVTSFYPMYIAMLNITDGAEQVELRNLASPQTGCLHDYQLKTADVVSLEEADVFVANGAGMESFLTEALENHPDLPVITATEGIDLLYTGEEEDHNHNNDKMITGYSQESEFGQEADADGGTDADQHSGHNHEESDYNAHSWMSLHLYAQEILTMAESLAGLDPRNAVLYRTNAAAYAAQVLALEQEIQEELAGISIGNIIILHDAFAYFAEEFGIPVAASLEVETDSGLSAKQIVNIIQTVEDSGAKAVFAEKQYSGNIARTISEEAKIKSYVLDSCVTGAMTKDAYLEAMKANANQLKEAMQLE